MHSNSEIRRGFIAAWLIAVAFMVLGGLKVDALGMPAEEVLPQLFWPTKVVQWSAATEDDDQRRLELAAPHGDADIAEGTDGLVTRAVWPVMAWYEADKVYPILAESWQTAYLSYAAKALEPVLGGGIEGPRRLNLLVGLLAIVALFVLALRATGTGGTAGKSVLVGTAGASEEERRRSRGESVLTGLLACALLATSVHWVFICRTAYHIESGPALGALLATCAVLAGTSRLFVAAGVAAGFAVALKVTAAWVVMGVALALWWGRRWPRQSPKAWVMAVAAATVVVAPILWFLLFAEIPSNVSHKADLLADPLSGLLRIPKMVLLSFFALGDPLVIMEPVLTGATELTPRWWQPIIPFGVSISAVIHIRRSEPDGALPERLWLSVMGVICVLGGLLYSDANPFQVVYLMIPFYVLALARAVWRLGSWACKFMPRNIAYGLAVCGMLGIQLLQLGQFIALHDEVSNPMLSMAAQRELAAALEEQGITQPLTVTYNAVGPLEMLSEGRLAPIHLYRVLFAGGDTDEERTATEAQTWRSVLKRWRGPIVMPLGTNIFEGGDHDVEGTRVALEAAVKQLGMELHQLQTFPAQGTPMMALLEVRRPPE